MSQRHASALGVVSEFYGEEVGPSLLSRMTETPNDQLAVLAQQIVRYHRSIERALIARQNHTLVAPSLRTLVTEPLYTQDELFLRAGSKLATAESGELKRLLLYCNRIVVPDLTIDWAEQIFQAQQLGYELYRPLGKELANAVRMLLPLRPLIESGIIICVGSAESLGILDDEDVGRMELRYMTDLDANMEYFNGYSFDPYIAWLLLNRAGLFKPWERRALDLDRPDDILDAARYAITHVKGAHDERISPRSLLQRAYGPEVTESAIQDSVTLNVLYRLSGISPVVTSVAAQAHLARSSRVVLDGVAAPDVDRMDAIALALKYAIPEVAGVSLADIIQLRLNEELYDELRTCLVELAVTVGGVEGTDSYTGYRGILEEVASDVVTPTYERIRSEHGRRRWMARIGGYLGGGFVTLGINALAALAGGPAGIAVHSAGAMTGNSVRQGVSRRISRPELETARSILFSVGTCDV